MKFYLLCFAIILIVSTSCSVAYRTLLGVDSTPNWLLTERDYAKAEKKIGIEGVYNFELDTSAYADTVRWISDKLLSKNNESNAEDVRSFNFIKGVTNTDLQPVQFRMFDSTGKEIYKIANCYVDIFPIDWNYQNSFSTFPPRLEDPELNTHHFDIHLILNSLTKKVEFKNLPKTKYYSVIFWNKFMIRPSKKLIKQIEKSFGLTHPDVTYIYINNHNASIWNLADSAQKEYLKESLIEYEQSLQN